MPRELSCEAEALDFRPMRRCSLEAIVWKKMAQGIVMVTLFEYLKVGGRMVGISSDGCRGWFYCTSVLYGVPTRQQLVIARIRVGKKKVNECVVQGNSLLQNAMQM